MAMVLALFFRRSGISIGLYFLYAFIIENLLVALINRYLPVGNYLPLKSADQLIPAPSLLGLVVSTTPADTAVYLAVSLLWMIGLWILCHYRFQRADL
ncbi:MAG: hypothetical protein LUD68_09390 [Rikenellaceae bacterium]|nr:hypothetical protein [Rikenellaceae bacterium]